MICWYRDHDGCRARHWFPSHIWTLEQVLTWAKVKCVKVLAVKEHGKNIYRG